MNSNPHPVTLSLMGQVALQFFMATRQTLRLDQSFRIMRLTLKCGVMGHHLGIALERGRQSLQLLLVSSRT